DESQEFANEITNRHFFALAEIYHLAIKPIAHRAPLVLLDQHFVMKPEGQISIQKSIKLGYQGLEDGRDGDRVVHAGRNIADAKLKCRKERVRTHVPIDLLGVVDAPGLDKQFDVALKGTVGLEVVRNASARHPREYFRAIRFQSRVHAEPKR